MTSVDLNIGSLAFGLIAWLIPLVVRFRAAKLGLQKRYFFTIISFSACAVALCLQFYEIKHRVEINDFAAIMDTIAALAQVAVILSVITILLNVLVWQVRQAEPSAGAERKTDPDGHL